MNCFVVVNLVKIVFELKHLQRHNWFIYLFVYCRCWISWIVRRRFLWCRRSTICSCLLLISCCRLLRLYRRCTHCNTVLAFLELSLKFILLHICCLNLLSNHFKLWSWEVCFHCLLFNCLVLLIVSCARLGLTLLIFEIPLNFIQCLLCFNVLRIPGLVNTEIFVVRILSFSFLPLWISESRKMSLAICHLILTFDLNPLRIWFPDHLCVRFLQVVSLLLLLEPKVQIFSPFFWFLLWFESLPLRILVFA